MLNVRRSKHQFRRRLHSALTAALLCSPLVLSPPAHAFRANFGFWVKRVVQSILPTGANFLPFQFSGTVRTIDVQSDQKRLVGGEFTSAAQAFPYLGRLNSDGTLDTTFTQTGSGFNGSVSAVAIDANGKTVVGGYFTSYNGTNRPYIARVNTDGTLDTTFVSTGTELNASIFDLKIDGSGKIVVGGWFTSYAGTSRPYVARLNSDGSLDTTFSAAGTGLDGAVNALEIDGNGKIVVGGSFTSYNGTGRPYLARLNTDGSLDTTFVQSGSGFDWDVSSLKIDGSGKILVGGSFTSYNGANTPYLARINSNGTLDGTFSQTGFGLNATNILAIEIDGSSKILAGGSITDYDGTSRPAILRLNSNGSLDTTFAPVGTGLNFGLLELKIDGSGKIVISGTFTQYNGTSRPYAARLNSDGSLDSTFAAPGLSGSGLCLAIDGSGKVIIGGTFNSYSGTSQSYVARLNSDGTHDSTFSQTGTGFNNTVEVVADAGSGKAWAGGSFSSYNGTARQRLARLNSDGSLDTSFAQTGSGLNSSVLALAIDGSGKIVVGGYFTTYNGTTQNYIARLNSDGSLDTTFAQTGTGLNFSVLALAIDGSGKIVVGGSFTAYNGTARKYIARLNTDGSLDTTFAQTGTGLDGFVNALAIDGNGKIVVGGSFTAYNGTARKYIARLNSDGSLDTTFTVGTGFNFNVEDLKIDSSGNIVVGGIFTSYNGTGRSHVARISSTGNLDTTFAPTGTGFDANVFGLAIDGNAKILVGGNFTAYAGTLALRYLEFY